MSKDLSIAVRMYLESNGLTRGLRNSTRELGSWGRTARRELGGIRDSLRGVKGQLAAIGVGFGITALVKQSAQLDKTLIQVRQTAGATTGQMRGLRTELFAMSRQTGESVNDLLDGTNNLIQAGLNWKQAIATIKAVNPASAVTGASQSVLASGLTVGAQAYQFDLARPGVASSMLDKMTVAGRLGNAELENLSSIFARVGVNAKSGGFNFDQTLGFIEQLSQIERQPERLATLAESTMRLFTNARYLQRASMATGVKFFDKSGGRRDPFAVLKDISAKYRGLKTDSQRARFIQAAFGRADLDTQRGLRSLLSGNSLQQMRSMTQQISHAGGTINRDLKAAISNSVDQVGRLKSVLRDAADSFSKPINSAITRLIKFGLDSKKNGGMGLTGAQIAGGGAALVVGGVLAKRYGGKVLGKLLGKAGGLGAGVATGKALEAAGVTPVYVVNMPGGGLPGNAGLEDKLIRKGGSLFAKGGLLRGAASFFGRAGLVGASGVAGYKVGDAIYNHYDQTPFMDRLGGTIATVLARFGNKDAQHYLDMRLNGNATAPSELHIKIDSEGRPKVTHMSHGSGPHFSVDAGPSMVGP